MGAAIAQSGSKKIETELCTSLDEFIDEGLQGVKLKNFNFSVMIQIYTTNHLYVFVQYSLQKIQFTVSVLLGVLHLPF